MEKPWRKAALNRKDHEKLDIIMFGKTYSDVHEWIDACFDDYWVGGKHEGFGSVYYHWCERHHYEAIKEKYMVGDIEWRAAKMHIISDWLTHWGHPEFPENKEEVIELLDRALGLK